MKILSVIICIAAVFVACEKNNDSDPQFRTETISMGTNSVEDVYYSLETGIISSENRADWDIAFSVPLQTATILINEGAGVELYCVGDTSKWATVPGDALSTKNLRFNDKSDWNTGAFNQFATGFPNYGWGTYHGGTPDHNVGGDSLYVIKLTDGTYKKLIIRAKMGVNSVNIVKWANLDGTQEHIASFSTTPYFQTKNFIHYSLVENALKEVEPDDWDLLFTRYIIKVPTGPSTYMNYPVTGVLSYPGLEIAKVTDVHADDATDANSTNGYEDRADVIGSDWKASDPVTHAISIVDSASYFIRKENGSKYQIYFTGYSSLAEGSLTFKINRVE